MRITQTELIQKLIPSLDKYSWFLGAGTSVSANLPTANNIIWDLKKTYYCLEENQNIKNQDIQLLPIKRKIQEYMESKGYPAQYDEDEYSFYFELMFGNDREAQRKYLAEVLSSEKVSLSIGHRVLAALMFDKTAKVIYTTNFDKVIENAYAHICNKDLASFHLEGVKACKTALNNDEFPLYAKVHGDFQYQRLFNLEEDLQKADEEIRQCFAASSTRFGTIVAGYSGRDKCIIDLFNESLDVTNAFPHGLYWAVLKGDNVNPKVEQLIAAAQSKGIAAYIAEIDNFDSLMSQIWRNLPNRQNDLDIKVQRANEMIVSISMVPQSQNGHFIRFNALPITGLPKKCYTIKSNDVIDWKELKKTQRASRGELICWIDEDVCVWGSKDEIENNFPQNVQISTLDISAQISDLQNHKALHSALEELLCVSIAKNKNFVSRKNAILISKEHFKSLELQKLKACMGQLGGELPSVAFKNDVGDNETITPIWSLSLGLSIRQTNKNYLLILSPDIWISPPKVRKKCMDFVNTKRKQLKNDKMDSLLSAWIETIFEDIKAVGTASVRLKLQTGDENTHGFTIATRTAYSRRAR
ncbi:MAG: SIR2 family protein [Methylococcales bacterium]|nr:SIR2 family protein [Methylococcales bacterium]